MRGFNLWVANVNGQEKKPFNNRWFIFLAIVIFFFVGNYTTEDKKTSKSTATQTRDERKRELTKGQIEYIEYLIKDDSLYVEFHNVYIEPTLWLKLDALTKESFTEALAIYCGNTDNSRRYFCDIYDKMSAKKIAKYGAWGFKVY